MAKQEFKSWDQYSEEAKIDPFELPISKDETLIIEAPNSNSLLRIHQGMRTGDLELIIHALSGDHWPRLKELFSDPASTHKVLPKLVEDMMDHFDLYEPVTLVGPGGGKVTRKRPREIKAMIEQGYRPAGEGPASSN